MRGYSQPHPHSMRFSSVQTSESGCRGPAASYVQHLTAGRIRVQFAVWYLLLVLSRKGFQGYWSPSLLPHVADNFWQDLCVGACMVRLGPPSLLV